MQKYLRICEQLHNLTFVPLLICNDKEEILHSWPRVPEGYLDRKWLHLILTDFREKHLDPLHPLISCIDPGYFLGVAEPDPGWFIIVGLVGPFRHTRQEVLSLCTGVITPSCLQAFCDLLLQMPAMNLFQVRDLLCILTELAQGHPLPPENVLLCDVVRHAPDEGRKVEKTLFDQREDLEFHVPTDFEETVCQAVESGNAELLMRRLSSPITGSVGRMSVNDLRQQKYSLVCLATLISRAAIRGGLPRETAFILSDLYCQRADMLGEIPDVEHLTYEMALDFCEKVRQVRGKAAVSPVVQNCIDYISVHLHEPLSVEDLSSRCGLCSRSLSLRFKKEVGMGIPEYIHREKMKEARYLLRHTDYSLSRISSSLNYASQSYFTRIFKQCCGQTPQQYRDSPSPQ